MGQQSLSFGGNDSQLTIRVEKLTPQAAKAILNNNHQNNRKIKPKTVTSYARQMRDGLWRSDSGEGISISASGKLLNGQHRLSAIIEYGHPVEIMIIDGVPDDALTCIDDGLARTISDAFEIQGKTLPNQAAVNGALACLMTLRDSTLTGNHFETSKGLNKYSLSERIKFYDSLTNFPKIAAKFFSLFKYTNLSKTISLGPALALYYLFQDQDEEVVYSVFKSLETGIPMDNFREKSPCYHMFSRVRQSKLVKVRIRPWEYIMMWVWTYTKSQEQKQLSSMPKLPWVWESNPITKHAIDKLKRL